MPPMMHVATIWHSTLEHVAYWVAHVVDSPARHVRQGSSASVSTPVSTSLSPGVVVSVALVDVPAAVESAAPVAVMLDSCLSRSVVETSWDARAADAEAAYEREEYRAAFKIYLRLAMEGHATSQYRLARMFEWSDGVVESLD